MNCLKSGELLNIGSLYNVFFMESPIGIFVAQEGKFVLTNPEFGRITGYSGQDLRGKDSFSLIDRDFKEMVRKSIVRVLQRESDEQIEFPITTKGGQVKWIAQKIIPIQYRRKRATLGFFMDITNRLLDHLTGFYNRLYLEQTLKQEIARAKRSRNPLAVAMYDLDNFKVFNDTYGHAAGDLVLKSISEYVSGVIRESDIPCRYGGEEFVVVMANISREDAIMKVEKICQDVAKLVINYKNLRLPPVTISLGLAVFPEHGQVFDKLLDAADGALYRAKRAGRNQVCVAEEK